jgi:arabinofuranosyltransferase
MRFAEPLRFGVARGLLVIVSLGVSAYVGWETFWFLTDDAFIAFRYASNLMLGRGLVWNPAPFSPVEGYTSFLWTVLLWATWKWSGVEPPGAANWLSLAFACGTLTLIVLLVARMRLPAACARARWPLLVLVLAGTLTNRTFLAWMSSGLETALVNFLITVWMVSILRARDRRTSLWPVTSSAALLALARPDGLLFVASTVALLGLRAWHGGGRRTWCSALALGLVPLHLLFRLLTYGELVPNTHFAKHVASWPESGLRYAATFALEYGLWVWLLLAVLALRPLHEAVRRAGSVAAYALENAGPLLGIGTLVAHVGYYTLIIGGDHFEFRVYSHLIPLLFASAAFMAAWSLKHVSAMVAALGLFMSMSWPIPWTHWAKTHALDTIEETYVMVVPVTDGLPPVLRPLGLAWDGLEAWLIPHHVGMRHQEHKVLARVLLREWPTRADGVSVPWSERAVTAAKVVGVLGWILPNVAVIDLFGLNDRVIAHTPVAPARRRLMAHDRGPPAGYVECFKPNLRVGSGRIQMVERILTDDEIRRCERTYAAQTSGLLP